MADKETLDVYAREVERYAKTFNASQENRHMHAFLAAMPQGAHILDLGCGPGHAAAYMTSLGHHVDAWDASPAMVEMARDTHGLNAEVAEFQNLEAVGIYHGIYANFSLLHAPKASMPDHLSRISQALEPGGRLHIGLKSGKGEKRDRLGRFYAYYEEDELASLLTTAGFDIIYRAAGEDTGLDGTVAPWIILQGNTHG